MINSITDEFVLNHQFSWQPDFSVSDSVVIQVEVRLRFCWGWWLWKRSHNKLWLPWRCDSDGTQTHDLQNRNLTLYSTELPSHLCCISAAKLRIFIEIIHFIGDFCLNFEFNVLLLQVYHEKSRKNDTPNGAKRTSKHTENAPFQAGKCLHG